MASDVTFDDRGSYLRCRYVGPFALPALLQLTLTVREYCKEHGCERLLVDLRELSDRDGRATSFRQ